MKNKILIFGGIGVIVAYLLYKYQKKSEVKPALVEIIVPKQRADPMPLKLPPTRPIYTPSKPVVDIPFVQNPYFPSDKRSYVPPPIYTPAKPTIKDALPGFNNLII